ncbi:MAG: 1,4-alpha-glucan branching enzyme GlgB [Anaerolineae bacterium]|nr:1,4-alpha-glucan branching enzyme GlgB [Anaerolineae bacterium]
MTDRPSKIPGWRNQLDRLAFYSKQLFRLISPATQPGMGALPHEAGTSFRVWAPHAGQVFVTGTFNNWSRWRSPLAREANGYWSANVAQAGPGDTYKYIIIPPHGQPLHRTDPYARDVTPEFSNSVICNGTFDWGSREAEPLFQMPGWHELVIYELHVGTFEENPAGVVGTFQGVINKLPYLQELGINAIQLMPVAEFEGDYSWGYNPAHPFAVSRTYDGRAALKELVKAAHSHGIAVILDVVYNHFGPQDLSLWQFDGWHQNGLGGIYFYNDWRSKTPWADTRPDFGRLEVRQYLLDNALMWLEEFQLDGLRWDATNQIRNAHGFDSEPGADIAEGWEFMKWVNSQVDARLPWKLIIAEDMQGNAGLTRETATNGAGFDSQWDATFVHTIRQAVITPHDEDRDMTAVAHAIAFSYNGDVLERVIFTESHDEIANGKARVPEEIAPAAADSFFAKKRSALGAALLFTAPGIPMIFQGQEFLESGWFDDHVPLDWAKAGQHAGIVQLYRDLIRLRRNWGNASRGLTGQHTNVFHVNNQEKVIAFHRWHNGGPGDDVIVVANFAHQPQPGYTIGLPRAGLWRIRFNSDEQGYAAEFGHHLCPDIVAARVPGSTCIDEMPCFGNVTIAPYSVLILSQDS